MSTIERVTVTLSTELVEGIDRLERNRSRFIAEAVQHELARRRREELLSSVGNPHAEAVDLADTVLPPGGSTSRPAMATRNGVTEVVCSVGVLN